MRIVIALGGKVLMARGAAPGGTQVLAQVRHVARQLALVARGHTLVLTLGHGPQAALLALQTAGDASPRPTCRSRLRPTVKACLAPCWSRSFAI